MAHDHATQKHWVKPEEYSTRVDASVNLASQDKAHSVILQYSDLQKSNPRTVQNRIQV